MSSDSIYVAMGHVVTAKAPTSLSTILGSCVALMMYESAGKIGGMAHILLSGGIGKGDSRYSDPAMEKLITEIKEGSSESSRLIAKLVGGASSTLGGEGSILSNISRNTVLRIVTLLLEKGIDIEGMHIGGVGSREVVFDLETGKVNIKLGSKKIVI